MEHGPKWRANPLHSEDETENEQFTLEKIELQAKWNEEVQIIKRKFEKKMEELKKRYERMILIFIRVFTILIAYIQKLPLNYFR